MKVQRTQNTWDKIAPHALMSLVCFCLGALLLFFMVWKAEKLVALGLSGRIYYIILLPLGLAAAGFLFGVLQSYASYRGAQFGGTLRLGGPILALLLVEILGFKLAPDPSPFSLTVYVHGPGGIHDIVLRNSGEVFMDLSGDRRHVQIGEHGQAYFIEIPANFRGQSVPIWVSADKFELIDPAKRVTLDIPAVYLTVRRKAGHISGRVESNEPSCVAGAELSLAELSVPVDASSGNFKIEIPGDLMDDLVEVRITAPGCDSQRFKIIPNSEHVLFPLEKSQARKQKGRP